MSASQRAPGEKGPGSSLCDSGSSLLCPAPPILSGHTSRLPSIHHCPVLEQLLTLSQRHLCRLENGCALSFPPPCLSRADLCLGRSFPRFYFWSSECCGPMLFPTPALVDTSPVISESLWMRLSIPEQGSCQSAHNVSATHPSHSPGSQTAQLPKAPPSAVSFLQRAWKLMGSGLLFTPESAGERVGLGDPGVQSSSLTHGVSLGV